MKLTAAAPQLAALLALCAAIWLPPVLAERPRLDAIVAVDITQSMNTRDMRLGLQTVSRLEAVKAALTEAVPRLPCGSRLGLGVFTEYRVLLLFTPVETCALRRELLDAIGQLNGQMAWAGESQIAKGVFSALRIAQDLPDSPAVVFLTDGHEAPPINARHRPEFSGTPGAVAGMLVGVGGAMPVPIPKVDPAGRPLGVWRADEVLQADLYTTGRQGSLEHEPMPETEPAGPVPSALLGQPGSEHLSFLHESYLQLLAEELRLGYARLDRRSTLATLLQSSRLTRVRPVLIDVRWIAGLAALALLVVPALRVPWRAVGRQPMFTGKSRPIRLNKEFSQRVKALTAGLGRL